MPVQHVYEYAVIRVLPVVEREEYLNVGIIVFCKATNYIAVRTALNEQRLAAFATELDIEQVRSNLTAFQRIAEGAPDAGPIAALDVPSRFRWLTAVRSSSIQTSRPHPGLCDDPEGTIDRLFRELVL
jgi:hypothetical protein